MPQKQINPTGSSQMTTVIDSLTATPVAISAAPIQVHALILNNEANSGADTFFKMYDTDAVSQGVTEPHDVIPVTAGQSVEIHSMGPDHSNFPTALSHLACTGAATASVTSPASPFAAEVLTDT